MTVSTRHARPGSWTRLILDEAFMMTGAQFREIALPLLMVALWPGSQSFALALAAVYLPSVVLARAAGRLADGMEPKTLILLSYAVRIMGVLGLLLSHRMVSAIASVVLLGVGMAINGPALTHYQASTAARLNQVLVSRLRLVDSLSQAFVPVLAGGLIEATGRDLGFLVSLACYVAAFGVMAGLPRAGPARVHQPGAAKPTFRLPRAVLEQMAVGGAIAALSWMANVLYTAYMLVDLHSGALRYGLALGIWGGAGILSAAILPRLNPARPERLITALIVLMAVSWAVMTRPVGYWVVAGLGLPEGFGTFLLADLVQSRVLTEAGSGERGRWEATRGAWTAGGRLTGLAVAASWPWLAHVHATFFGLASLMLLLAVGWVRLTGPRLRSAAASSTPGSPAAGRNHPPAGSPATP
jgi:hypothetical protein